MIAVGSIIAILTSLKLASFISSWNGKLRLGKQIVIADDTNEKKSFKKFFAFELLILLSSIFISAIVLIPLDYHCNELNKINSEINDLKQTSVYRKRYSWISDHYTGMDSYETYKEKIFADRDTTYRRWIFDLLQKSKYEIPNYGDYDYFSFEECLQGYQDFKEMNRIDSAIAELEKIHVDDPNKRWEIGLYLVITILIITYPVRFLFYLVVWALRTLKEEN
jgi:hypothetical protein